MCNRFKAQDGWHPALELPEAATHQHLVSAYLALRSHFCCKKPPLASESFNCSYLTLHRLQSQPTLKYNASKIATMFSTFSRWTACSAAVAGVVEHGKILAGHELMLYCILTLYPRSQPLHEQVAQHLAVFSWCSTDLRPLARQPHLRKKTHISPSLLEPQAKAVLST